MQPPLGKFQRELYVSLKHQENQSILNLVVEHLKLPKDPSQQNAPGRLQVCTAGVSENQKEKHVIKTANQKKKKKVQSKLHKKLKPSISSKDLIVSSKSQTHFQNVNISGFYAISWVHQLLSS